MKRMCLENGRIMFRKLLIIGVATVSILLGGMTLVTGSQAVGNSQALVEKTLNFISYMAKADSGAAFQMMNDAMRSALTEPQFQELWSDLTSIMGKLKSWGDPFLTEENELDVVYLPTSFENGIIDLKVVFDEAGLVGGLRFVPHVERGETADPPPPYADKSRFGEKQVSFGLPGWDLKGTLTYPNDRNSFPVVVLVHGSGPNDRDETIGPNKPFRDLAWGLASRGIGVFRYDKRTYVYGEKMDPASVTVEQEVIEDALEAIRTVQSMPEVQWVYVLGHSLGGMLAPEIAARAKDLGGAILLAGSPRNLEDLILDQVRYLASFEGEAGGPYSSQLPIIESDVEKIKSGSFDERSFLRGMSGAYIKDLHSRDILETATELDVPMLILQGGRDYQVRVESDYALWEQGLAGKRNVTSKIYPDLNHLFMTGEGMATPAEYRTQGFIDERVIWDISTWIDSGLKETGR